MSKIFITAQNIKLEAELNDSPTSKKIFEALPIQGRANVWGEEIYFEIPVIMPQELDARQDMQVGEMAYWPTGRAFCIFFGPTPVSTDDQPRAYSPVNLLGRVSEDATLLKLVQDGEGVSIEKANE